MLAPYPGLVAILGLFAGGAAGMLLLRLPERILPIDEAPSPLKEIPRPRKGLKWWAAATYPWAAALAWVVLGIGSGIFYFRALSDHPAIALLLWSLGMSCNLALSRAAYELAFGVTGHHPTPWSLGNRYQYRSEDRIRRVGGLRLAITVPAMVLSLLVALLLAGGSS